MPRISLILRCCLAVCLLAAAAFAQKSTGEIRGTVFDSTDAMVPKASVTAKDVSTGIGYTTTAGADGAYLVPNLVPGTYEVTATAPGFRASVYSGIVVDTDRTTNLNLSLKVGAVTETV